MWPRRGLLPGEVKQEEQVTEMKEHPVSDVLLSHKGSDLLAFVATVMTLRICAVPTFWTQHKSYAASRFNIIRTFESTSMLKAAINQYEERYPEREVKVAKDTQWYVRFVTTLPAQDFSACDT